MKATEFDASYQDLSQDKFAQAQVTDSRKPRLTLKQLNKLKKTRAAQDLENRMRHDTLEIIYGTPAEAPAGGGL
jgi:hypothetical protein